MFTVSCLICSWSYILNSVANSCSKGKQYFPLLRYFSRSATLFAVFCSFNLIKTNITLFLNMTVFFIHL